MQLSRFCKLQFHSVSIFQIFFIFLFRKKHNIIYIGKIITKKNNEYTNEIEIKKINALVDIIIKSKHFYFIFVLFGCLSIFFNSKFQSMTYTVQIKTDQGKHGYFLMKLVPLQRKRQESETNAKKTKKTKKTKKKAKKREKKRKKRKKAKKGEIKLKKQNNRNMYFYKDKGEKQLEKKLSHLTHPQKSIFICLNV